MSTSGYRAHDGATDYQVCMRCDYTDSGFAHDGEPCPRCSAVDAWGLRLPRCECGEWSGVACDGLLGEHAVTVEYMPRYIRAAHQAARNSGVYPHNGAVRLLVTPRCAAAMIDGDVEWCSVVEGR